jgi:hypothetical protein
MAVEVIQMYVDGNIAKLLRAKYGNSAGSCLFLFFEEWRNYGPEYIMQNYPPRTYYYYINRLIDVGLAVKERYGTYNIAPGYEYPAQ